MAALAFDASGKTLFASGSGGGGSANALSFEDGAAGAVGSGRPYVAALDATTGAQRWMVRPGGGRSEGIAMLWGTDIRGNILFSVRDCFNYDVDTEALEGEGAGTDRFCVGAYDAETGAKRFVKRMGGLRWVSMTADASGFWLSAPFSGRPDFGTGKVRGGNAALVHYVYR